MNSFLDRVSADLYNKYGSELSKLCLVFPSRRARLFFAESLSKRISRPLWQPEALSISELIFRWTGRRPSDPLRLMAELYKVYPSQQPHPSSTFDDFFFRGEMLISDFDQIDKYLVPAKQLFENLRDQKMIESDYSFLTPEQIESIKMFWSSFEPQQTELQQSFTKMWALLYPLYTQFREALQREGLAYEGMLYRQVAEDEAICSFDPAIISYVFIGFNALNECERKIFHRLQASGKALFYWDRDDYYTNNNKQEAGSFIRKNVKEFPPADADAPYSDFSQPKEIESWAVPSDVLQTKLVPQIIRNNNLHTDKRTAVVLCDESLLIPLLSALPEVADNINITMGYPLSRTSLYSFTETLLLFYHSFKKGGVYHLDALRLLSHPFISYLSEVEAEKLKARIVNENLLYLTARDFGSDPWLTRLAQSPTDPDNWLALFTELLEAVGETLYRSEAPDPLLPPILRLAVSEVNKFRNSLQKCGMQITMPLCFNLLRKTLGTLKIPFSGEPLQGIQVMGILETRTLDFEHVVLLSAQEGFLPSAGEPSSFIPHNLKAGFGLPLHEEHEAMYAYYFYRLLQRAQKVSLLYASSGDAMQTGEKSRYLLQLAAESPHKVVEKHLSMPISLPKPAPRIEKEKDQLSRERLSRYLNHHTDAFLAPSAIIAYLQCPLQFYYRHIERIREDPNVMEEADPRAMGSVLHGVMDTLYRPFLGCLVTSASLDRILSAPEQIRKTVEEKILEQFAPHTHSSTLFEQGRWLILADVLTTYIKQIIRFDKTQTPFTLKMIETTINGTLQLSPQLTVSLGGVLDRMDERGGVSYVVDYKTGKDQRSFESLSALFAPERDAQNSAVFQIFWYVMLCQENAPSQKVLPSLYYIRSLFGDDASTLLYDKSSRRQIEDMAPCLDEYRALLSEKLRELFDPSLPFTQTTDTKHCTYCNFSPICRRE